MEPLLASRIDTHSEKSPYGDSSLCVNLETSKELQPSIDLESSQSNSEDSAKEYVSLQRRIFRMTLVLTVFTVLFTTIFVDLL